MQRNISDGFTIVELLVVIVVIGVIASISIISYTGISQQAISASIKADLNNASKQLKLFQTQKGYYPVSIDSCPVPAEDSVCLSASGSNVYTDYQVNNSVMPQTFSLAVANGSIDFGINEDSAPLAINNYRQQITIDHTKVGSGGVTDFPVLVDLSDLGSEFFSSVMSDGRDIRITKADGTTQLPVEVVSVDTGNQEGEIWFKADTLSDTTDTSFYIHYGNATAQMPLATDTNGSQAVWGSGARYVGHFESSVGDSSSSSNDGTLYGGTIADSAIGSGYIFNGISDYVTLPAINDFSNGYVVNTWIKNYKSTVNGTTYQAESIPGASTGDNYGNHRRGRLGIDTAGGTLLDYVIPNTDYGSKFVTLYGYQTDPGVTAGTFLIKDETTGATLSSGNLIVRASGDPDKRLNSPYIVEAQGHPVHVYVYFSNTTDLYIDYLTDGKDGYDGIISKASSFEMYRNGGFRNGINSTNIGTASNYTVGTYQKVDLVYNKTDLRCYVNGILSGTWSYASTPNSNSNLIYLAQRNGMNFWGEMDEIRLFNNPSYFTQSRMSTEYNNQSSTATFYSVGVQEN
jgi:prepilin-type N-terminal cleavage/methylation domain-containing protein